MRDSERVRVFDLYAASAAELEMKLNIIEGAGIDTKLTMNMGGMCGDGAFWIICRETPEYERMEKADAVALKRALQFDSR